MDAMVSVKDGEVWAHDSGEPDAGGPDSGGLPLVLLHPGVGDSRVWDPVLPHLTERHRVIRYDARGYGRSPAPTAPYSLVEDLIAVLDHFGAARAVLAGSSMGGATAISLALRDPARVAALALVVPGVTGAEDLVSRDFTAEVGKLAEAGDVDGIVALVMRTSAAAGTGADLEVEAHVRSVIPAWFAVHPYHVPDPPAFDRLGELDVPCVLVLGERDQPEVVRTNEAMARRIPGCRLVRLAHSDHFPTVREPSAVAEAVLEAHAAAGGPAGQR
ncbi:alpha/beta fold hydrolase [Streptomyces alboniger]|uniref:Alpha/beta fold hydrolase n=1 Tax=Streptomyces alboniger TaxID=132473 RepID=A0A5J6HPI0_STRAD|nr:alpha/beta fold hydrolase [Streptomyces alboniger]QEV21398.1 alpha/beta fold hydrolase [Streptomyces alboniger]